MPQADRPGSGPASGGAQLVAFSFWLGHATPQTSSAAGAPPAATTADPADPTPTPVSAGADPSAEAPAQRVRRPPTLAVLQQAMTRQLERLGHPGAEPLRWAITGVDSRRGLRLEGIGLRRAVAAPDDAATTDPLPGVRSERPAGRPAAGPA